MIQSTQPPRSRGQVRAGDLKPLGLALSLVFGYGAGIPRNASAATITVTDLSGGSVVGQCTLRDAVTAANTDSAVNGCAAGSGADVIQFAVNGSISLGSEIGISSSMTISGPGAAALTIAPSGTNRAFNISGTPAVAISGVTFQGNGTTNVPGAAILQQAPSGSTATTVTIQNAVFSGNVTTASNGGALFVYNAGAVTIASSTFTGNRAAFRGGAAKLYKVGPITITDSTFSSNTSGNRGGALFLYKTTTATISGTTFSGNTAANRGGAMFLYKVGATTIVNSTISGNAASAVGGGGIYMYRSPAGVTIANSTLSGNTTAGAGGAIAVRENTTLTLLSTIVANSTDGSGNRDIFTAGTLVTVNASNSLVVNPAGTINGTNVANIFGQNPLLGPLANNGGATLTHALLTGSPAIGAGSNPLSLAFDQRGTGFARTAAAQTDIGAFEIQAAAPAAAQIPVPTLSQWGTLALSGLLGAWALLTGFARRRRPP